MSADSPYPEMKKSHTMAHAGRPWRDFKPPPSGPVWSIIQGFGSYWTLVAAIELDVFDEIQRQGPTRIEPLAETSRFRSSTLATFATHWSASVSWTKSTMCTS